MKILGIADSDSYVKWGAAALAATPAHWDKSFVIIETPFLPTESQRHAAVEGLPGFGTGLPHLSSTPEVVSLAQLTQLVEAEQPDAVLLSLRGPMIRVIIREIVAVAKSRPILISGLPGISIPATRKALTFRSQVDLIILHSKHEIRDFTGITERLRIEQEFGLATLPFLREPHDEHEKRDEIVFAVQAKVPKLLDERVAIVNWLAECARRNPKKRVVIKLRAVGDEKQTHAEEFPYDQLLAQLKNRPANLVTESGSMAAHLQRAVGLVTVSSTALIEAAASGVPGLALDDFGVRGSLINTVFEGSGLLGSSAQLVAADFRHPSAEWLDDNYFHAEADNDWIDHIDALTAARDEAALPLRRLAYGRAGGRLRFVWDRKRALGELDTSVAGHVALVIGYPARQVLRIARRTRGAARQIGRRLLGRDPQSIGFVGTES
ncbi:MAG TPA: DUF6716 putative glycosyltransferase [Galbitalea sp.]